MTLCRYHPDRPALTSCTLCNSPICNEDRRIKSMNNVETLMCVKCYKANESQKNYSIIFASINAIIVAGIAAFVLLLNG